MTVSTLGAVEMKDGTAKVAVEWQPANDVHLMWSILTGIEQARRKEGREITDADLDTDDDTCDDA